MELRHAFALMSDHNPSLLELFHSPLVYRDLPRKPRRLQTVPSKYAMIEAGENDDAADEGAGWAAQVRALMARHYDRPSLLRSWYHHTSRNYHR